MAAAPRSSCSDGVLRVKSGDPFLDRRLLDVDVFDVERRRNLRDETMRGDGSRIEGDLDRPAVSLAPGGPRKIDRSRLAGELHPKPPFRGRAPTGRPAFAAGAVGGLAAGDE